MVNEEVNRLKGIEVKEDKESTTNMLDITTSISTDYVDDESLRIEIHKLINEIIKRQ